MANLSSYGFNVYHDVGQVAMRDGAGALWLTTAGCDAHPYLLNVSFENGEEISRTDLIDMNFQNALVLGQSIAGVPTASEGALILLAVAIAAAAVFVLRGSV